MSKNPQPEFDFEFGLPSGQEAFSVGFLAKWFGTTIQHWINQVEDGSLRAVNLASKGKSKSYWRIARADLLAYLRQQSSL